MAAELCSSLIFISIYLVFLTPGLFMVVVLSNHFFLILGYIFNLQFLGKIIKFEKREEIIFYIQTDKVMLPEWNRRNPGKTEVKQLDSLYQRN